MDIFKVFSLYTIKDLYIFKMVEKHGVTQIFLVLIHGQYLLKRPFFNPIVFKRNDYGLMHKDSYWDFDINWGQQWWVTWRFSFFFHFCSTKKAFRVALKGPCIEN